METALEDRREEERKKVESTLPLEIHVPAIRRLGFVLFLPGGTGEAQLILLGPGAHLVECSFDRQSQVPTIISSVVWIVRTHMASRSMIPLFSIA